MSMAHSVEGRFPFLDYRLVEFCNRLPSSVKLHGLTEKWLLKQLGRKLVPSDIWQRPKRPYRAPIQRSFFGPGAPAYVRELLSAEALAESGLFNPAPVQQLAAKAAAGHRLSEVEDMAVAGVLSTQLVYQQFVKDFRSTPALRREVLKTVDRVSLLAA
jgi:asparagine synthase (glutamine-hydrolysing)